jgi:hypothetical protein
MKNGLIITEFGTKRYYLNNKYHRVDGPAIEYSDGSKSWYLNGKLHREDGPAYEDVNGTKEWYVDNEQIFCKDNKHFLRLINLKAFW